MSISTSPRVHIESEEDLTIQLVLLLLATICLAPLGAYGTVIQAFTGSIIEAIQWGLSVFSGNNAVSDLVKGFFRLVTGVVDSYPFGGTSAHTRIAVATLGCRN